MRLRCILPVLFLLLSGLSFAADVNFIVIVPVVAVIVAIIIGLAYMLSTATADPRLGAWAKTELREFVLALFIIAAVSGLFIGTTEFSKAVTGQDDYVEYSIDVVDEMIDSFDAAYISIIKASGKIRIAATFSTWAAVPIWFISFIYSSAPLSGIGPVFTSLGIATQGLTNVIFLYEGLRVLIVFLQATIPPIILPLAFAVRLFPFTRKVGNAMIAVSLAGILLLPLSVVIIGEVNKTIDYPYASLSGSQLDKLDARPWSLIATAPICGSSVNRFMLSLNEYGFAAIVCLPFLIPPLTPAYPGCFTLVSQTIYHVIMLVIQIVHTAILATWLAWADFAAAASGGAGNVFLRAVWNVLRPFLESVTHLILTGYIDIIIVGIITISGARSISSALGGEWQLPGLERLI